MAFAAPEVVGAARAAAGAKAATKAAGAAKATTARGRGTELLAQGKSRKDAARIVRDEFGSTLSEAEGALPPAEPSTQPAAPRPAAEPGGSPARPASSSGRAGSGGGVGSTLGGLILGVMAWAVGLSFLRGGAAGVTQLLRAKFLNQTGPRAADTTPGTRGGSGFVAPDKGGAAESGGGVGGGSVGSW